jgi:dihydrofolate reductase
MGKLIYAANTSLDGYLDETGSFDWSVPDGDVHAFWNEHERHVGTSLYGRRMYETMRVWESDDWLTTEPAVVREYAEIWRDTDKIVYSSTLEAVSTARTRVERQFEPEAVRQLKRTSDSDLSIGGATVAAEAFRHGLVDECVLLLCPRARGRRQAGAASVRTTRPRAARPSTVRQWCDLRAPRGTRRYLTRVAAVAPL